MKYLKRLKEYWWMWAAAVAVLPVSVVMVVSGLEVGKGLAGVAIGSLIVVGAVATAFWPSEKERERKEEQR